MGALQRIRDRLHLHQVPQRARQIQNSSRAEDSDSDEEDQAASVPDTVGVSGDGEDNMGNAEGVAEPRSDISQEFSEQVVGRIFTDSTQGSDSGRDNVGDTIPMGSDEESAGCEQQWLPGGFNILYSA